MVSFAVQLAKQLRGNRVVLLLRRSLTATGTLVLADLVAAGSLTPVIHQVYPLGGAIDALRMLESGDPQGEIVVTP